MLKSTRINETLLESLDEGMVTQSQFKKKVDEDDIKRLEKQREEFKKKLTEDKKSPKAYGQKDEEFKMTQIESKLFYVSRHMVLKLKFG